MEADKEKDVAEIDIENFRANVRFLCSERGSCRRLADEAAISRPYLSDIMRGVKCPSLGIAFDIARALRVSLDALVLPPEKFSKKFRRTG